MSAPAHDPRSPERVEAIERLGLAWPDPPFTESRRDLYLDVLADVPTEALVLETERLMREDNERLPAPGVIRARALGAAARGTDAPEAGGRAAPATLTRAGGIIGLDVPPGPLSGRALADKWALIVVGALVVAALVAGLIVWQGQSGGESSLYRECLAEAEARGYYGEEREEIARACERIVLDSREDAIE